MFIGVSVWSEPPDIGVSVWSEPPVVLYYIHPCHVKEPVPLLTPFLVLISLKLSSLGVEGKGVGGGPYFEGLRENSSFQDNESFFFFLFFFLFLVLLWVCLLVVFLFVLGVLLFLVVFVFVFVWFFVVVVFFLFFFFVCLFVCFLAVI